MQLARNLFLGADQRYQQSMDRKMQEAGLAQELTTLFSKDEVLEMYLNLLNYGHLVYGPEAAAQIYFGKPAADLTLAEATLLAGIPLTSRTQSNPFPVHLNTPSPLEPANTAPSQLTATTRVVRTPPAPADWSRPTPMYSHVAPWSSDRLTPLFWAVEM